MTEGPIFLERKSYRTRRMLDAIRMLPVLGLLLWMVPLFWPLPGAPETSAADPIPMSVALRYLFGVWVALVIVCFLLWRRTASGIATISPNSDATE
ncbi:hypothetical protein AB2B41_02850 [Marimonas sp. MJW-29]|uniref:Uncharacterized protein n=1 Tax=Sulfitobacter sediminis TaxID=3234186 RepID=A0ABV3RIR1_9RHOB